MTIIEKMYAGQELSEAELECIATGYDMGCDTEPGEYEEVDAIEGDSGRWSQSIKTIILVGDDFWMIPWRRGLTEMQENEFMYQPCRVVRKERVVTEMYYEPIVEADNA